MARKYPELFKRLFCYCGCDVLANKKTLFDSFTDDYAMDEPISRQEAALAYKLYEEGKSLAEIQQAIDDKFSADYPYTEPSKALLRYRKSRSRSAMKPLKSHGSYNVVKTNSNCQ